MRNILLAACATACAISGEAVQNNGSSPPKPCSPLFPKNDNMPYLAFDFLYWVPKQEGNDYAVTGTAITVPGTVDPNTGLVPSTITSTGSVYAPNPEAKPGFKVSLGLNLNYESWELFSNYSYLSGKEHSTVSSNQLNTGILPLYAYVPNNGILSTTTFFAPSGATGFVTNASSQWHFQYNNINLELGKSIPLFCNTIIRPHFGLEGSWQTQNFGALYKVSSIISSSTLLGNNKVNYHQTFWGVGPRVGLGSSWQLCKHLGFFADSAFALLWGSFKGKSTSFDTNSSAGYANVMITNQINQLSTLSPMIELSLGISSDWLFKDKYRLVASLGWDTQVWFFQNQHSTSIPNTDLLFQGLDAGLRFDF